MPLLIPVLAVLGVGAGIKMAGDGVNEASNATVKVAVVAALGFGAYYLIKKGGK